MRRTWVVVAGLLLLGGLAGLTAPPAAACSCAPLSEAEYMANASVVFEGVATAVREPEPDQGYRGGGDNTWTFRVDRVLKGSPSNPQDVLSHESGATCGDHFDIGTAYRVHASPGDDGRLHTHLCGGNRPVTASPPPTQVLPPTVPTTTAMPPTTRPTADTTVPATTEPPPETTSSTGLEGDGDGDGEMTIAGEDGGGGGGGVSPVAVAAATVLTAGAVAGTGYAVYRRRIV